MEKKRKIRYVVGLLLILICLLIPEVSSAQGVLSVPEVIQQEDYWCWAACSSAVMLYYDYGNDWVQCGIADQVRICKGWGFDNCCLNPSSVFCNQANSDLVENCSIPWVLVNYGYLHGSTWNVPFSKADIISEINAGRPFIMHWQWKAGTGHALVGHGIIGDYVFYMNPGQGYGYQMNLYDWVVSSSDHDWVKTMQITTPPIKPNLTPSQPAGWSDKIVVSNATGTNTDSNPLYSTDTLYVDWAVTNNGTAATSWEFLYRTLCRWGVEWNMDQ